MRDRIAKSFHKQGFMRSLDARIDSVAAGRVTLSAPVVPATSQQHGFAHAGLTFALGDSASGYAALSQMPEDSEVMTVEMKINLIAPADGVRLWAHGEVMKPGRRLVITRCTVEVERADGSRRDVALLQGTMIPV
ncbi:MAG: PaaI family thioesterase [Roseicyclus sp.]|nr:PaaI family thioesterase [Roseicyclus sp.]MBO6624671.1 PaaI family thioesterase [Roseicyclus sp.]MBO6921663.1 PaaI family thioesterase [Roseicyclus sp.]